MDTTVYLDIYSDYYMYDDGTFTNKAALMIWSEPKNFPPLQRGMEILVGGYSYIVKNSVIDEFDQVVTYRINIGYNRYRDEQLKKLKEKGWILKEEYESTP